MCCSVCWSVVWEVPREWDVKAARGWSVYKGKVVFPPEWDVFGGVVVMQEETVPPSLTLAAKEVM